MTNARKGVFYMDDPKYYRPIIAIWIETLIISALTTKGCEYSLWITRNSLY